VALAGASAEGCISVDTHGVALNGNVSAEVGPKVGGSFGLDMRYATNDAAGVNRNQGNVRSEKTLFPGFGRFKTGSVGEQVGLNPDTGQMINTVKVGLIGVDLGKVDLKNFGWTTDSIPSGFPDKTKVSAAAGNTGYIFRW
jgi:hypothetical protein